jgi:polyphosphate:AMP phosphotransferase
MFQSAEIGHSLSKDEYKRIEPRLRADLLDAQYELSRQATFPVVILIGGVRGAGKGETVNLLNAWMDPRHISTHAFDAPTAEERGRPPMWRYWQALPPRGKIGIMFDSWYTDPILDRVQQRSGDAHFATRIEEIIRLERLLTDEGALVLKFWFHLSKAAQKHRLRALEADPLTRWQVTDHDWESFKHYDRFHRVSESVLRQTSFAHAPWIVVDGTDAHYRSISVGKVLLKALRGRLKASTPSKAGSDPAPILRPIDGEHLLKTFDLRARIDPELYRARLAELQQRLALTTRHPEFAQRNVVCVFEGMDAAGKGGAIRRLTQALDARRYRTIPIASPVDEERAQPYLWRFWRHLPGPGRFTIYDRSWYGRVLVERVEGFCSSSDWLRAYGEINDFEAQLVRHGTIICKFWLQISKAEQLKRFKAREKSRFKRFKITEEDWRNRDRWDDYQIAASDMVERTSTPDARWTLVAANDKNHARIQVLETIVTAIEKALANGRRD